MKLSLGASVITKKIGLPGTGVVQGIVLPEVAHASPEWDEKYPNWREKVVALVKLNKGQRPITLEEFKKQVPPPPPDFFDEKDVDEEMNIMYQNNVKLVRYAYYPVDDLEPL